MMNSSVLSACSCRALQEFSEGDAFALSMSMSMSTSPEGRDASLSVPLVTDAPNAPFRTERLIPCSGTASTFVSMLLEVELVVGKTVFTGDLEQALTAALLDGTYTMCDPRRRLTEKTYLHQTTRSLQESILLSPVVVTASEQSCITTDTSARPSAPITVRVLLLRWIPSPKTMYSLIPYSKRKGSWQSVWSSRQTEGPTSKPPMLLHPPRWNQPSNQIRQSWRLYSLSQL
jgi:hypothetical protein